MLSHGYSVTPLPALRLIVLETFHAMGNGQLAGKARAYLRQTSYYRLSVAAIPKSLWHFEPSCRRLWSQHFLSGPQRMRPSSKLVPRVKLPAPPLVYDFARPGEAKFDLRVMLRFI